MILRLELLSDDGPIVTYEWGPLIVEDDDEWEQLMVAVDSASMAVERWFGVAEI